MSASYDPTLPSAQDRMRQLLGDTNVSPAESALIPDETYQARLTEHGETLATAILAESLAARFGQEPTSVGSDGETYNWSDRAKTWLELAARLRDTLAAAAVAGASSAGQTARVYRPDIRDPRNPEYAGSEYARDREAWGSEW